MTRRPHEHRWQRVPTDKPLATGTHLHTCRDCALSCSEPVRRTIASMGEMRQVFDESVESCLKRPCTYIGPEGPCPDYAVEGGRCATHQRRPWETSSGRSRESRGYDRRWRKLRNRYLREHPVCEAPGCDAPADEVDHVIPLAARGARLSEWNLQSLCRPHHAAKTAREGNLARRLGGLGVGE